MNLKRMRFPTIALICLLLAALLSSCIVRPQTRTSGDGAEQSGAVQSTTSARETGNTAPETENTDKSGSQSESTPASSSLIAEPSPTAGPADRPSTETTHDPVPTVVSPDPSTFQGVPTPSETTPAPTVISDEPTPTLLPTSPTTDPVLHTHAFGAWVTVLKATCVQQGLEECYCSCGVKRSRTLPQTDHAVSLRGAKPASCTEDGYTGDSVCLICGKMLNRGSVIPASGHHFNEKGVCTICGAAEKPETGDFGASFSDVFLRSEELVRLTNDWLIRAYAKAEKLPLCARGDAVFSSLYRSGDIFTTLCSYEETNGGYLAKYYVFDIYVRSLDNFYTVHGAQKDMHDHLATAENYAGALPVIAINGDYSSNGKQCRVAVRNGRVYRSPGKINSDVCVMYHDGSICVYSPAEFDYQSITAKDPYQIWNFGPGLLDRSGKALTSFDESPYELNILRNVHPRTALGYYEPGHYCFVISDGRQKDENGNMLYGCTMKKLASVMQELGCKVAYNLDGGASSQAYMCGRDVRIDGTRDQQRVLSDIICIGETEK